MRFIFLCFLTIIFLSSAAKSSEGECTGKFINPITDICWDCLFPLSIGSIKLIGDRPDTKNPSSPLCLCPGIPPRPGIAVGLWEPVRLVDVTKKPFCFPNLNGLKMSTGFRMGYGKSSSRDGHSQKAAWNVHYYIYPLLYWLEIITDFICVEKTGFDVAYISELDPTWLDDDLNTILNPEGILFGNIIAQSACVADCTSATRKLPRDELFWCAGCQGSLYPMNGRIQSHTGSIQSALLAAERITYRLHRIGLAKGTMSSSNSPSKLCQKYYMPIMKKSQYRSQLTVPIPTTSGKYGCNPFGLTTTLYEAKKEVPIVGEDFGFLLWRKRNCCAF